MQAEYLIYWACSIQASAWLPDVCLTPGGMRSTSMDMYLPYFYYCSFQTFLLLPLNFQFGIRFSRILIKIMIFNFTTTATAATTATTAAQKLNFFDLGDKFE